MGSAEDRNHMKHLRSQSDAILMGASTLRTFKKPCYSTQNSLKQPINVIISSQLERISSHWKFFTSKKIDRILFVGPQIQAHKVKKFSHCCEIVTLKTPTPKTPIAQQIVCHLEKRGIQRLLVEGGGEVMWDFVSSRLIDQFHITLTPKLLGGKMAPTLVDGEGFLPKDILNLKLVQCRIVGNEIYLVYARKNRTTCPF